jgi:putative nucleotidyltransferase with HDIG domain
MLVGTMQTPGSGLSAVLPAIQARSGLCELPVFGPVALKMLKLLANEVAEVRGIAGLLKSDPALSAEVLAVANSSFYGTPHRIDNLARAILVLGFEQTRSLTLTVALRSFTRHPANPKIMQGCWQHSLAAALLAEELAPLYDIAKDQAYTAALIHDVGRLGLLRAYGEQYAPIFATRHNNAAACLEAERRAFEMDHCQAGLWLTQRWDFPSEYSRVASCHHDENPTAQQDLVALTRSACLLADALGFAAVILEHAPTADAIVMQLPANPWNPYTFQQERLKIRIARQVASMESS